MARVVAFQGGKSSAMAVLNRTTSLSRGVNLLFTLQSSTLAFSGLNPMFDPLMMWGVPLP